MPWLEDDPTGPHLHKSDGRRLLAEALAAQVETILADETRLMCAEAAVDNNTHECRCILILWFRKPGQVQHAPLARSLSKLAGTGKPDGVVSHFCGRTAMNTQSKPTFRKVGEREYLG